MKSDFSRRVSLPHKRKGDLIIRRNTRNRPLRSMQKVELAVALHDAGLADRLFHIGLASVLRDHVESADNYFFWTSSKSVSMIHSNLTKFQSAVSWR